jgi:4-amino-4-deoxy-L-arabinose transferase-like glycosyltransferase
VTPSRLVIALIVVVAAGLRLWSATGPLDGIEAYEFIPAATTLTPDHLPIRLAQHGALPAYLIRGSSLIFGNSDLGFRAFSIIAGTATVLLLYLVAARWWGSLAGLMAAALLAIDRYHIEISARAIDLPFDLMFVAAAIFCVSRFLHGSAGGAAPGRTGWWLIGAGAATALGFLCKEFTALMVPAIFLTILLTRRTWLRRWEPWAAAAVFVVLITPDVYASLTVSPADRMDLLARHNQALKQLGIDMPEPEAVPLGFFMSYGDQLSRFKSIGFSPEPFVFYFGGAFGWFGVPYENEFDEFPFMYPWIGALLWVAVIAALVRPPRDSMTVGLLTMFGVMFVPFCFVQLGQPRATFATDASALWYWVDRTMLPAMLLAGRLISGARGGR